jgi:hypothetical protein
VATLIRDLRCRLGELDAERAAIGRALRVLDAHNARQRPRDLGAALIDGLAAVPGSRASFLALELGVSAATAKTKLHELERSGDVVKRGLGWELARPK